MKKFIFVIIILLCINTFVFSEDEMENWTFSNIAIQFPMAIAFDNNFDYMYFSFGIGMRIKTFADSYIHPSISYAMIFDTHTVTYESAYIDSFDMEEVEFLSKAAFRIAF